MEVLLNTRGEKQLKSLLFLYVFVRIIAAECPKPMGGANMVPNNEALLKNDFPDGSQVTLLCGNGYVKESGSGIITCVTDKWTDPDLICKRKDCGLPKAQPYMHFDISEGTLFGAAVKVSCEKGYEISGSVSLICFGSGWFGDTECVIVFCDQPPDVANAEMSWSPKIDLEYGDIISYTCDAGYTLSGSSSIMCSETGEYNPPPPECIGVTTEATFTTKMITSASASPEPESSTSAASSTTPAAHRVTTITASASPSSSTSDRGARYRLTAEERSPTTTVTSTLTSFGAIQTETINTSKDNAVVLVTVSVLCFLFVLLIFVFFVLKFYLRRKGSYDTREDQKPELLQFQNL